MWCSNEKILEDAHCIGLQIFYCINQVNKWKSHSFLASNKTQWMRCFSFVFLSLWTAHCVRHDGNFGLDYPRCSKRNCKPSQERELSCSRSLAVSGSVRLKFSWISWRPSWGEWYAIKYIAMAGSILYWVSLVTRWVHCCDFVLAHLNDTVVECFKGALSLDFGVILGTWK